MNMRESVATSLQSSHLEPSEYREVAIDRVGALARATKLGRLLWRWKYAKQDCHKAVLSELLVKARHRLKIGKYHKEHPTLERACKQAMLEWYSNQCRHCQGAEEVITAERRIACPVCNGTGVHRYTDYERMDGIGVSKEAFERVWDRRLRDVFGILTGNDASTNMDCAYQLERV